MKPRLRPSATFENPLQASSLWNKTCTYTNTNTNANVKMERSLYIYVYTFTQSLWKTYEYKHSCHINILCKGPIELHVVMHICVRVRSVHINMQCDVDKALPTLLKDRNTEWEITASVTQLNLSPLETFPVVFESCWRKEGVKSQPHTHFYTTYTENEPGYTKHVYANTCLFGAFIPGSYYYTLKLIIIESK